MEEFDSGEPDSSEGMRAFSDGMSAGAEETEVSEVLRAGQVITGSGYEFDVDEGKLTVTSDGGTVDWIANSKISNDAVKQVVVGKAVKNILGSAFYKCENLTTVEFAAGSALETIREQAFYGCTKLKVLDLANSSSLKEIGDLAFFNCAELANVKLTGCSALETIGKAAFSGCSKLGKLDMSGCTSLSKIGNSAFYKCSALSGIFLKNNSAPTLESTSVFDNHENLMIYVPATASGYTSENHWPSDKLVFGAALSGIAVDGETLVPTFRPNIYAYTVNVPFNKDKITVTPTALAELGITSFQVNGKSVPIGYASEEILLNYGANQITVAVTNGDGTKQYELTVNRTLQTVTPLEIKGITPPVRGEAPATAITETEAYTGTVEWEPGVPVGGTFAADTVYTAVITLTAKSGYTLDGVKKDSFQVTGAVKNGVTNAADTGVIRAVFPKTASEPVYIPYYYTIQATAGEHGTITPSGSVSVREYTDQTFTFMPEEGYETAEVLVDGKRAEKPETADEIDSYKFERVTSGHTISVSFLKIVPETYPEGTVSKPDGSFETPDGVVILPDGTVILNDKDKTELKPDSEGNAAMVNKNGTVTVQDGSVRNPDGTYARPAKPTIERAEIKRNRVDIYLEQDTAGAKGYDYVISPNPNCIKDKDYTQVSKNVLLTNTSMFYVQQDTYYVYCHSWLRDSNGKKVFSQWSEGYEFTVSGYTPDTPSVVRVSNPKKGVVVVTVSVPEGAKGFDVILGRSVKKVNGEKRPVDYGTDVRKNQRRTLKTVTFENVKPGKVYAALHSYSRIPDTNAKVFSRWSAYKTIKVK